MCSLWKKTGDQAVETRNVRKALGLTDEKIIFGVDRLDYTKGIPDRLRAFARLLDRYPEWRTRVSLVQVGAPSRESLTTTAPPRPGAGACPGRSDDARATRTAGCAASQGRGR